MEDKYFDLLLVEKMDGGQALATVEPCAAKPDYIVELCNGEMGTVTQITRTLKEGGDLHRLLQAFCGEGIGEAKAVYRKVWKLEENA